MGLNRTTLYYKPKGESTENLKMLEMMDKYYLDHPTAGVLTMVNMLILAGLTVGIKRVRPFDAEDGTDGYLSSEMPV